MDDKLKKERYILIDILKALFAYLIMCNHIVLQYGINNNITRVVSYVISSMVVTYFFVASRYFLYNKSSDNLNRKGTIIKQYAKKNFDNVFDLDWNNVIF